MSRSLGRRPPEMQDSRQRRRRMMGRGMARAMSSSIVSCWEEGSEPAARFCCTSRMRLKVSDWVCFMISSARPVCIFRLCCSAW